MSEHKVRDDQLPKGVGTGASDVPIVPSASVLLLRGHPFEILLVRRADKATFVPGAWVFPGGIVEATDRREEEQATARTCAVRELHEEVGIRLAGTESLVWTARWITPAGVPKRFDTWFFIAELPEGQKPVADETESVELRWFTPTAALDAHRRNELVMVFPTIKNLEALLPWSSIPELLAARKTASIPTTRPVIVVENGQKKVVLPDA